MNAAVAVCGAALAFLAGAAPAPPGQRHPPTLRCPTGYLPREVRTERNTEPYTDQP